MKFQELTSHNTACAAVMQLYGTLFVQQRKRLEKDVTSVTSSVCGHRAVPCSSGGGRRTCRCGCAWCDRRSCGCPSPVPSPSSPRSARSRPANNHRTVARRVHVARLVYSEGGLAHTPKSQRARQTFKIVTTCINTHQEPFHRLVTESTRC